MSNKALLDYYERIKENSFSGLSYPIEDVCHDYIMSSDVITEKQKSDYLAINHINEQLGNKTLFAEADAINTGLSETFNILTKLQPVEIQEKLRNSIICKALPTGEANALVTKEPNSNGYLVLLDSGFLMLGADIARLSVILIEDYGLNLTKRKFAVKYLNEHLKSLRLYTEKGIYYSFANKYSANDQIDIVRAGRMYMYVLKFVLGHEISHVHKKHFDEFNPCKSHTGLEFDRVLAHSNELEADIGSMEFNLESFPNKDMLYWDIYKESMIAPFLVLGAFSHLERFSGRENQEDSTHPSSKRRLINLVEYYKRNIGPYEEIFDKASRVLERYGVDPEIVKMIA